jgi:hypothetical protein
VSRARRGYLASQPVEADEKDELELGDDRAGDAYEEVEEASVLEMVLDPGAAHPANAAVNDGNLAMVDMAERGEVPARRASATKRSNGRTELCGAHDADLDICRREPVVEDARATLGIRALPVDDQPDRDAFRGLLDERRRRHPPRCPAGSRTG